MSRRPLGALLALVGALGAFTYAWYADPGEFIGDDGGITLRYASRIASGAGYDYNDYERVNGASSPLWTLWLAGGLRAGLDPARVVELSAAVFWTLAGLLIGALGVRRRSLALGLFGAMLLWTTSSLHVACFTGLESGMTMTISGLALVGVAAGSTPLTALGLGLAVASKLDGSFLAIAFAVAVLLRERRFPWRVALLSLLVAAPMLVFLTVHFGSPIPNSALTKVSLHSTSTGFDPMWVLEQLWQRDPAAQLAIALLAVTCLVTRRASTLELTLLGWYALHVAVYSSIDLGDPYPWYTVAPAFASIAAVVLLVARLIERLSAARPLPWTTPLLVAAAAGLMALELPIMRARLAPPPADGGLSPKDADDLARLQAGAWIARHAGPNETLAAMFGLPALAYPGPFHDISELNSRSDPERLAGAAYYLARAGTRGADALPLPHVARFRTDSDGVHYDLYAKPTSAAVRAGARHFLVPLVPESCAEHGSAEVVAGNRVRFAPDTCLRQTMRLPALPEVRWRTDEHAPELPVALDVQFLEEPTDPRGLGTVEVHLVAVEPEDVIDLWDVTLRIGEPLRAEELPVPYRRWLLRTEYLEQRGYP